LFLIYSQDVRLNHAKNDKNPINKRVTANAIYFLFPAEVRVGIGVTISEKIRKTKKEPSPPRTLIVNAYHTTPHPIRAKERAAYLIIFLRLLSRREAKKETRKKTNGRSGRRGTSLFIES